MGVACFGLSNVADCVSALTNGSVAKPLVIIPLVCPFVSWFETPLATLVATPAGTPPLLTILPFIVSVPFSPLVTLPFKV